MGNLSIQTGISLICCYIIYWCLVRHRQNYFLNRIFILASIIISGLLPFLDFPYFSYGDLGIIDSLEPVIIPGMENRFRNVPKSFSFSIYSIVYIVGMLVVAGRSIAGLATLFLLYRRSPKKNYHGFTAVILRGNQSPFTFFNLLFINENDFEKETNEELIFHEKVHRDQGHTIDLVIMEIFTIVQWFNPFVWLFKRDLKSEHEFMADELVIKKGFNKSRYQYLLLQSHEGMAPYLANSFNNSVLKKRLIMMKKQKSTRRIQMNYALAMPALLLTTMILFFNFQLNGQITASPDVLPSYLEGEEVFYKTIQKSIKYPLEARKNNVQGTVLVSFTITSEGKVEDIKASTEKFNLMSEIVVVGYMGSDAKNPVSNDLSALNNEAEQIMKLIGDFNPGEKDGKAINTRMTLPITFKLQ
jgi:hypothetical protein